MDTGVSLRDSLRDSLTDVRGLRVGHATRTGDGRLTGTTVVLAPEGGAVAAVDVRGGGPGTRETDALDPRNLVQRVDAVVLTGGSAYGLDAASGVMAWLEEQGRGFPVGGPGRVVPVVPAACVFDLGRGGDWRARPDAATGREAAVAAAAEGGTEVAQGSVGAGTGAVAGGMKGGVGTASIQLESGHTVGALVVVNAAGEVVDPGTGVLYGRYFEPQGVHPSTDVSPSDEVRPTHAVRPPHEVHTRAQAQLAAAREESARRQGGAPLNTTLAVVATDAQLTRAQAQKLAGTTHDGLARAVRPVHLLHDGDTVFALATDEKPLPEEPLAQLTAVNAILAAGADAVTRAIVKGVEAAGSVDTAGGVFPSYRALYGAS